MRDLLRNNRALVITSVALLSGLAAAWLLYLLVGHRLLQAMYRNESLETLNHLIAGRDSTPLEAHYEKADTIMRVSTLVVTNSSHGSFER